MPDNTEKEIARVKKIITKYIEKLGFKFGLGSKVEDIYLSGDGKWETDIDSTEILDLVILTDMDKTRSEIGEKVGIKVLYGGLGENPSFETIDEMLLYWHHLYSVYIKETHEAPPEITPEFKVGDHVTCIDDAGTPLIKDAEYVVTSVSVDSDFIGIKEVEGIYQDEGWASWRFKMLDNSVSYIKWLMRFFEYEEDDVERVSLIDTTQNEVYYTVYGSGITLSLNNGELENRIFTYLFYGKKNLEPYTYHNGDYRPLIRHLIETGNGMTFSLNSQYHFPRGVKHIVEAYWKELWSRVKQKSELKTETKTETKESYWEAKSFVIKEGVMEVIA